MDKNKLTELTLNKLDRAQKNNPKFTLRRLLLIRVLLKTSQIETGNELKRCRSPNDIECNEDFKRLRLDS